MGTTALRQLLKCLCSNSVWKYGVFWKLDYQADLILRWEDGYCHQPKPRGTVDHATDNICFGETNEISFKKCATSIHDGGSAGYSIGLAVADMSHLQYTFGKGVFGGVASTGNHSWVLLDGLRTRDSYSNLVSDCPDEWILQFALGIKTILIIPVLPHGVLQFGSMETVAEDLAVVAFMKDKFNGIHNVMGKGVSSNIVGSIQAPCSRSPSSDIMENTYESSPIGLNPLKVERSEDFGDITQNNAFLTLEQFMQMSTIEDPLFGIDASFLKNADEFEFGGRAVCSIEEPQAANQSSDNNLLDMLENQIYELSCQGEELVSISQNDNYNFGVFGESFNDFSSYIAEGAAELFRFNNDADHYSMNNVFEFPDIGELHKAIETSFQRQTEEQLWDPSISSDDTLSSSGVQKNIFSSGNPPWFPNGTDAENILEASVAKDDASSSISDGIKSGEFSASYRQPMEFEEGAFMKCEPVIWSHASVLPARCKTSSSFTGMMNTVVDTEQEDKVYNHIQPKKENKVSSTNSRRTKPGNPKLRPRDRQLIQDRVKELRELVPNGAKCSINGLLDRTIKHMTHLRSMTDQAEKLKSYALKDRKAPHCNKTDETPSSSSNGTSRAFELGSELQISPIVVEDLPHPGHMLIEMLCDDHGLFLEIAQAIRRLELTVLKGVMETRSNNLWGHFVVEVPGGFRRMDVFWPLLHLLQRRRNSLSSKI